MFCTQCGFNNKDSAKFCKSCGKPLDVRRVQNNTQSSVQKSMKQYAQSGRGQTAQNVIKPVAKATGKTKAAAGGGFLKKVILVAAAVCFFIILFPYASGVTVPTAWRSSCPPAASASTPMPLRLFQSRRTVRT